MDVLDILIVIAVGLGLIGVVIGVGIGVINNHYFLPRRKIKASIRCDTACLCILCALLPIVFLIPILAVIKLF